MYKLFKRFQRKEVSMILLCLLFIVGQVWLDLTMPDYMSEITTLVQTEGSAMADIWLAGGKMLLCALGSLILSVMTGFLAAQVAASFSMRLRAGIFRQVESFSMEEINRFSTASLITRTTNDVTQIQFLIAMGLQVIRQGPHHGSVGHLQNPIQELAVDRRHLCRRGIYAGADCHCCHLCHAPVQTDSGSHR